MNQLLAQKRDALLDLLRDCGRVVVAFSGGVDSAVVARAAALACGEKAVAVTALSPSLARGELEQARRIADLIGIRHVVVRTDEFEQKDYVKNSGDRCYYCKSELYLRMDQLVDSQEYDVIVNGANADDTGDYRPGMRAARERAVRSPLIEAGLSKAEVRELARGWELPVWDKPATPCLSSRIAYGVEVTPERVARVDQAECFLREKFGLRELRVRLEQNEFARIELPASEIHRLADPKAREAVVDELLKLGFRYVTLDLQGFRSGSMNEALPMVETIDLS